MEEILKEILRGSPTAGAILVVMFFFMKVLAVKDKDHQDSTKEHVKQFSELTERTNGCIQENSKALGESTAVGRELKEAMLQLQADRKAN